MEFKKSILILILAIFLISIASVCASDVNDTLVASEDTNQIELSSNNEITEDNLKTSEENTTLTQTTDDETLSAESDSQTLRENEGTYYNLIDEIGNGGDKNLAKSYYRYTGGNTIEITSSGVINGNGAVIDMAGSTIRAFTVSASDVTFRNLTIKNANFNGDGGAIYFGVPGTVENCTFIGNKANGGGAMCEGIAINCKFIENSANGYGGAINGYNHKSINCTFISNSALNNNGGALSGGEAYNCSFISNFAGRDGGAINDGKIYNCNFTENHANGNGGAMKGGTSVFNILKTSSDTLYNTNIPTFTVSKSVFRFDSGDKLLFNLTFDNKNYDGYNTTINIAKDGNPVGVYYALSGSDEGWSIDLSPGIYSATLSMEPYTVKPITVYIINENASTYSVLSSEIGSGGGIINLQHDYYIYDNGPSIEITEPNTVIEGNGAIINMAGSNIRAFYVTASYVTFRNLTIKNVNYDGYGGAIYLKEYCYRGNVINCNFTDNSASAGGVIYFPQSGTVTNCNFNNNRATSSNGGAINMNFGTIENCNFTNNFARQKGGAIYFSPMGYSAVKNCNFANNFAGPNGGAICLDISYPEDEDEIVFASSGTIENCNFINNNAGFDGGAIYICKGTVTNCRFIQNYAMGCGAIFAEDDEVLFDSPVEADTCIFKSDSDTYGYNVNSLSPTLTVNDFVSSYNSGDKLTFDLKTNKGMPVSNGNISISVYYKNNGSWVGDYSCLSGEGWTVDLPVGSYYAIFNTEYYGFTKINRTITITPTFMELNHIINSNDDSEVNLTDDYCYNSACDGDFVNGIVISRKVTINGNGHTIDAQGKARVFNVQASDVLIKNLTIINANDNAGSGGAIYFSSSGTVENCNFTNNTAEDNGGAINFAGSGAVTNCNFNDNQAKNYGGAINMDSGTVTNCNFNDNRAKYGGAISVDNNGEVTNCNFANNAASNAGGAIYAKLNLGVTVDTCIFKTGSDNTMGTSILPPTLDVDNFTIAYYSGEKLTFDLKTNSGMPVDNGNILISVYYKNNGSWVGNYSCLSGEGWTVDLPVGSYYAIFNTEYAGFTKINRTITIAYTFLTLNHIINANDDSEVYLANDYEYYSDCDGDFINGISINRNVTINGNGHTIDAQGKARIFNVQASDVTIKNLTIINAKNTWGSGGAIYFSSSGTVENCNFTNNIAMDTGGAIYFAGLGTLTNCNFNDNYARQYGGALCFDNNGEVTNCNFANNTGGIGGGAIYGYLNLGVTADTCIFKTDSDKAIRTRVLSPTLDADNFTTAAHSGEKLTFDLKTNSGMPVDNGNILISVYYKNNGSWVGDYSCLSGEGWAVDLPAGSYYAIFNTEYKGFTKINRTITIALPTFWVLNYKINDNDVSEVNLTNDYYYDSACDGDFVNGIVISRKVTINGNGHTINAQGKARVFNVQASDVTIKNLTIINANNNGGSGGAILFTSSGTVENCNFTNNFADDNGGAINFAESGTVTNCNFNDNQARNYGGAINIHSGNVTNCNFNNNHANSYDGGAINMGSGTVSNCNFNDNRARNGGAISIDNNGEVTNCNFANNVASMNGGAIYAKLNLGVTADTCIFKTDSDKTIRTRVLSPTLNVDNFTTGYNSGEKLTFDLKTNSGMPVDNGNISISVYYKNNDSWVGDYSCLSGEGWTVDLPAGSYYAIFNTEYYGFTKISRTITICHSFGELNHIINDNDVSEVNLTNDYYYVPDCDGDFVNGIFISRKVTINGNGHTIDAQGKAMVFNVQASDVTINNLTIINANNNGGSGGAIYFSSSGTVENCNFANNTADDDGGAINFAGLGTVTNCNFTNNFARYDGGAINIHSGTVTNCNFNDNQASSEGGAIFFYDNGEVTNCNFNDNQASSEGGAISFYDNVEVTNCNFTDNQANHGGAVYFLWGGTVTNCNFIDNQANLGGALYYEDYGYVTNCNFISNQATGDDSYGGAIYFGEGASGEVINCDFNYNYAHSAGAAICFDVLFDDYDYVDASSCTVKNCNFNGNQAWKSGGAICFKNNGEVTNCYFANNVGAIYTYSNSNVTADTCIFKTNADITSNTRILSPTLNVDNFATGYNSGEKLTFDLKTNSGIPVDNGKIRISVYYKNNDSCVGDYSCLSGEGWTVDLSLGSYYAVFNTEYAEFKPINRTINVIPNIEYYANVTPVTSINKTVNITAISNIPNDIIGGKLLFILPDSTEITANYNADGTWWAVYEFGDCGDYKVNASYIGLNGVTITDATIRIGADVPINVNDVSINYGEVADVIVGVPESINGQNITITVNGNSKNAPVEKGEAKVIFADLAAGKYEITADYLGDDYNRANSTTAKLTVNKVTPEIVVSASAVDFGKDLTVTVQMPVDAIRRPTVTIGDQSKAVTMRNGKGTVKFSGLDVGTYDIVASYNGDANYLKASANATAKVKPIPEIIVSANDVGYGSTLVVTVQMPADAARRPTVTIGDQSKAVTMRNGTGTVKFTGLDVGTYDIVASYNGDADYSKASAATTAKVKSIPEIIVSASDISQGEDLVVTVQLPSDATRRPTVTIGGESKAVTMRNGTGTVKFTGLDVGTYHIVASYNGDADYGKASAAATAKVKPIPEITVFASDIVQGEDLVVTVQLPSDATRRPTVTVGGESKLVTMRNGVGSVKFTGLALGTYSIDISYSGDANYGKASVSTSVKVNRGPAEINVTANPVSYGEDVVIDVQLPSDVTRRVSVTIGNETKMVSLKNGSGSARFSGLAAGTYDVSVEYAGDAKYLKSSQNTTVKVNKATPDIQITADDINYGKTLTVGIQLPSDVSRRATVKIDGVSKYVTLKNGVGSVKFTDLSKGTHEVIVSYDGDANYNKASATTTINVN